VPEQAFSSFVIFAEMRTGSNFLESSLNALADVVSHGEVFNPHFIGKKEQMSLFGRSISERDADPIRMWQALREETPGLAGFRFFHDHDPRILGAVMADPTCAKVILTRNPLESYVSGKIARQTGQWKLTNPSKAKPVAPVTFDATEFAAHLDTAQAFQRRLMSDLQRSGQAAFYLDYDDLGDVAVLNGLAAYLGVAARLDAPDPTLKKQNPGDLAGKLSNPEAVEPGLARLDRFNLHRTPSFEPRRPPGIPSFVAAAEAGLLYMPIRSGPEAQVCDWLASLSPDGLEQDFTQKSLRQWWRRHPRHCSFAVLRHPLLRAYVAFREQLLPGHAAEARAILTRRRGVDLPAAPDGFGDLGTEHDAFLAFLDYVRLNLAGQSGARVNPHWASQTAVLQGFAQFQGPDVVLREERLAEGLAFVAAEAGFTDAPALPPRLDDIAQGLAAIHDVALEQAAEAAYRRDYLGLGFGRWKAD
jgi:LPS sulfotransferase NodH